MYRRRVQLRKQHTNIMNRLKKELTNRGIIYQPDEIDIVIKGVEYDMAQTLVDFTSEVIICLWSSAVMEPILKLYDAHTLTEIGEQQLYPDHTFSGARTWGSYAYD